jgi:formate-dependent nitrite reductase membrane component NrfD
MSLAPPPSSTFFSAAPEWQWLIIGYFFIGGLAGGSYFLAVLIDFFGGPGDRRLARLGYYVAFPAVLLSGLLLTVDLRRPLRFWHMLVASETLQPLFKPWSPMSVGSWALLVFGAFTFLAFLAALAEAGHLRRPGLRALRPPGPLGSAVAVLGGLGGLFVAGYTGVLLSVTNRPVWADTPLLGVLFLVSAASISAALLALVAQGLGWLGPGLEALERFDAWLLGLELIVLAAFVVSLGGVARVWLSGWGVLLLAAALFGMLAPLLLRSRRLGRAPVSPALAAVLVLVGGFMLRIAIVLTSEGL